MTNAELVALARAALAVASGETTIEELPPEVAVKLGDVETETIELNQAVTKVAVRQFAAASRAFIDILLEQGVVPHPEGDQEKRKAVCGQMAVMMPEPHFLHDLLQGATAIRAKMSQPKEEDSEEA